ncbi:hypothetical protein [Spiroplasma endosymbiont of Megaselia nigra]|uniref:hypothetical protein n=1 Tax=Spiroplasma endosymbiont of Megaselia nigra TaxID=2478537 RepID=UPI000F888977|nr:hypothetical protein [Spiroplasma endosymbiont of Megaselia nigra]RUO86466.1 hypothetical protein D9R21_02890 [Spiroplasma endosymbiont of Megaselia nigra]
MKKLLSLLSVLTVSGSALPTTIAASPYQKQEIKILNSDKSNYSQTNHLKILNRNRRENKNKISGIVSIIGPKENKRIDFSTGLILDNKLYYCSKFTNSLNETDLITSLTKIISLEWSFLNGSNGIMLNNKQYVIQNDGKKVFEIDNNKMNLIIEPDGKINSSKDIMALNDKVYFVSDNGKIYEYNQTTKEQKIVMKLNEEIYSLGVVLNNELYFGSNTGKIYEYETLKLIESDVIDLQEQIRRGVYLYYQEKNPNYYVKNIEFNMNDLKYSDIELIKREFVSNIKEVENICDGTAKFENRTSDEDEYQTQSCKYTKQNIESYQILKGLNKRIDNTLEKGTSNTGTSSILNSNSKSTTSQTGGEVSAGGSLFGIGLSASISHSQWNEESST